MKRQSRPRKLSDKVELLIARRSLESKKPRNELAEELIGEIETKGERAPTVETLIKRISKARSHEASPLDKLWHLGTLKDYPLPPEGIAKVFAIKCIYGRPPKCPKGAWGITLSIREALWISRLSSLPMSLDKLEETALDYADAERVSELSGIPFDTYDRDEEIYEVLGYPGQAIVGPGLSRRAFEKMEAEA